MTDSGDSPRLLELADTPPALHKLLESARHDRPSAAEVEQLARFAYRMGDQHQSGCFLVNQLPPQAGARNGGLRRVACAGKFLVATLAMALSASALGAAGWSVLHDGTDEAASQPREPSTTRTPTTPSAFVHGQGPDVVSSRPSDRAPTAVPSMPRKQHGRSTPQTLVVAELAPQLSGTSVPSRQAAARPIAAPPKVSRVAVPDAEESRVLQAAREELPGNPARALALAGLHARRFPNGMLDQERETIAIEALVRLDRTGKVGVRIREFLNRFPASPYRGRVEALSSALAKQRSRP